MEKFTIRMSDINTYHKDIYEDYLAHSHKWTKHIIEIQNGQYENARIFVDNPGNAVGCIIVAVHVFEEVEHLVVNIVNDYNTVSIRWSEKEIPLEKLLTESKSLPRISSVEDIDNNVIPPNYKVVYPYEPFLYVPSGGVYEVVPDNDDICYVEYYGYCGKNVKKTFPYSSATFEVFKEHAINEDMTILVGEIKMTMYHMDKNIAKTLYELDENIDNLDYNERKLIMDLDREITEN